ncbi:hypothetical protein PMAYCL1PPCAC_03782, partial [Pristionchus mayeri]
ADGQPVLGCARPTCFGWAPDGRAATSGAIFARVNDHTDGFVRVDREAVPPYGPEDDRFHSPQTAICEVNYYSS